MDKSCNQRHIRWLIRRDIPQILAIERICFFEPWTEEDFVNNLRQRNIIGMVIELGEEIVGYFIYQLGRTNLTILNMAVDPNHQRAGHGTAAIEKLKTKLHSHRYLLHSIVRETNLSCQLFLRANDFKAVKVLRDYYPREDAYLLEYRQ